MNRSANTAMHRKKMSTPVRELFDTYLYGDNHARVLDFGCGRGKDVEEITKWDLFKEVVGYDPNFQPKKPKGKFNVVLMVYVVNVIERPYERDEAIENAWSYVKKGGQLVIVSRSEHEIITEAARNNWDEWGNGYMTWKNTYQQGYTPKQLNRIVLETVDFIKTIQYGYLDCGASMIIATKGSVHSKRNITW